MVPRPNLELLQQRAAESRAREERTAAANAAEDARKTNTRVNFPGPSVLKSSGRSSPAQNAEPATKSTQKGLEELEGEQQSAPLAQPAFEQRVSFNFVTNDTSDVRSLGLVFQDPRYKAHKKSRTYLCGTDESDYAADALEYMIDNLVDDGDDIICVQVVEPDEKTQVEWHDMERQYRAQAQSVLEGVQEKLARPEKPAIKVFIEVIHGTIGETFDRMVELYHPVSIIVGTRGKGVLASNFGKPSVSQHLYKHSSLPVIIVRPKQKRQKKLEKRLKSSARHGYRRSTAEEEAEEDMGTLVAQSSDHEREAVAKAIGLPPNFAELAALSRTASQGLSRDRGPATPYFRPDSEYPSDEEDGASPTRMSGSQDRLAAAAREQSSPKLGASSDEEGDFRRMPNFITGSEESK